MPLGQTLAKLTRAHARCREIHRLLEAEVENPAECKGRCQANSLVKTNKPRKKIEQPRFKLWSGRQRQHPWRENEPGINPKSPGAQRRPGRRPFGDGNDASPEGRRRDARGYRDACSEGLQKVGSRA